MSNDKDFEMPALVTSPPEFSAEQLAVCTETPIRAKLYMAIITIYPPKDMSHLSLSHLQPNSSDAGTFNETFMGMIRKIITVGTLFGNTFVPGPLRFNFSSAAPETDQNNLALMVQQVIREIGKA